MMTTISFKEIVKLIHPDINPNIKDVSSKMVIAKEHRADEVTLYKLAVQWGVVEAPAGFDCSTETPSPTASALFRERKLREYKEHLAKTQKAQVSQEEIARREYFAYRVRNRIFEDGDRIYIRTKGVYAEVTKVTGTRVYFWYNGSETYAAKKNVRFANI